MTAAPRPAAAAASAARYQAAALQSVLAGNVLDRVPAACAVLEQAAAAAMRDTAAAARVLAERTADPAAAAGLRAGADGADAALARLGARPAPAVPGEETLRAAGQAVTAGRAAQSAAAALRAAAEHDPPPGDGWLAEDVTAAFRSLTAALRRIALHAPAPRDRDRLHAAAFTAARAVIPLEDACARLHLAGLPPAALAAQAALGAWTPPAPQAHVPPGADEIAAHVRFEQAAARYRAGRPPRDGRDREWFTGLAEDDLAEAWHAEQLHHFHAASDGSSEHASCRPAACPLSAEPPDDVAGAARAARWLAGRALSQHFSRHSPHADACPPGRCPWESRTLPAAERAAIALERAARPPGPPPPARARTVHRGRDRRRPAAPGPRPATRRPQ